MAGFELLQYHKITRETCRRVGEIRQSRRHIFIAIVISSLM
jgi:hypothetical protein